MRIVVTSLFAASLVLAVQACGPSPAEINDMGKRARELAVQDAITDLSARSYQQLLGAKCLPDCSAQEAGYKQAAAQEISDPEDCHGATPEVVEGCRAFAREVKRRGDAAAEAAEKGHG